MDQPTCGGGYGVEKLRPRGLPTADEARALFPPLTVENLIPELAKRIKMNAAVGRRRLILTEAELPGINDYVANYYSPNGMHVPIIFGVIALLQSKGYAVAVQVGVPASLAVSW